VDIAGPYNPQLVQQLGLKSTLSKTHAQSRSSQQDQGSEYRNIVQSRKEALMREGGQRASISQTARKLESNFSSGLKK